MNKNYSVIGILGFIMLVYSIVSAIFYNNIYWYSYFVIGGTLFLAYLNFMLKNDSLITRFNKNKINEFKKYVYYLLFAISIEFIGRYILNLWEYSYFNLNDIIFNVLIIGYPFAFFFVYESFIMIRSKFDFYISLLISIIINALIHEYPNNFVYEWKYNIPNVSFEILKLNIVVWFGWIILIIIPLLVNNKLKVVIIN